MKSIAVINVVFFIKKRIAYTEKNYTNDKKGVGKREIFSHFFFENRETTRRKRSGNEESQQSSGGH